MKIKRVSIYGFRNIEAAFLSPSESLNVLWGLNGQGKTNFLEAIYTTLRAKSFRPYSQKADWFPLNNEINSKSEISIELENSSGFITEVKMFSNSQGRWEHALNQKKTNPHKLRTKIPIVVFSPDDHAMIRGAPEMRRDYYDEVLSDVCPGYAEVLDRFEESLKSRNKILKRESEKAFREFTEELKAWTDIFVKCAWELCELRTELWPQFASRFEKLGKSLFQGLGVLQKITWESDFKGSKRPTIEELKVFILKDIEKDLVTGWTHRGPHRDDIKIQLDGVEARTSASQGQARLCALLLKWLHADWIMEDLNEIPIFLIDDLSSELDALRRRKLLELTQSINGQIFVSTTEPVLVDLNPISEYTKIFVEKGGFLVKNP